MIGNFRDKIDIINFTTVSDGQGRTEATERVDTSVWAEIQPISGSRGIDASQIMLNEVYHIFIRYEDYPPLNKKNRFRFEGREFIIHSVNLIQNRRKYFKVVAMEDAARDTIIYDENFQPLLDENGEFITT